MAFVQIIECRTSEFDKIQQLGGMACGDRGQTHASPINSRPRPHDPSRHLIFAFFDSYEDAMKNSNLSETAEFSEKQAALLDGPVSFQDLDVIEDRS